MLKSPIGREMILNIVMTAGEKCQELGMSEAGIRQRIYRGLEARKSGGTWLVLREDI